MKWLLLFFVLLAAGCTQRDRDITLVNPGFETTGSAADPVPGWRFAQHAGAPAYEMSIDAQIAAEGHASFRMHRLTPQVYGSITQQVVVPDGARGKAVTLAARMKAQDVGRKGWVLMLTIVAASGNRQLRAEPLVGTHDFFEVKVSAKLPDDTSTIEASALLLDEGTGWLDDVHLRIEDK